MGLAASLIVTSAFLPIVPAGAASGSVGNLSVSVTPPTAGTNGATYSVSFTASDGINPASGTPISIVAPNGTDICPSYTSGTLIDHTNPGDSSSYVAVSCGNNLNSAELSPVNAVGASDYVTVSFSGVQNPGTPNSRYLLSLDTDNDPTAVTASYPIVIGRVGNLSAWVSPSVPGAASTYTLNFIATHGIRPDSYYGENGVDSIIIVAPNGTDFSNTFEGSLIDHTNPSESEPSVSTNPLDPSNSAGISLDRDVAAGDSVTVTIKGAVNPQAANSHYSLTVSTNNDPAAASTTFAVVPQGYRLVASDGGIFSFGDAHFYGSTGSIVLNKPIVGMAQTPDEKGYWLVASDGGVFSFGDAHFHGSTGGIYLNKPIVSMSATPDGGGYWLVASDGGIFSFGDAHFYGSTGGIALNRPVVGMASSANGKGYWLVASDGGIFSFGDAHFYGSMGGNSLNAPIVGMTATPDDHGYRFVAADGGIFSFGDAYFYGSMGGNSLNAPIVGMTATPDDHGYWFVAADGGIFSFGDAYFYGSMGGNSLNAPIVGMAA
jgi:hypothetical protein